MTFFVSDELKSRVSEEDFTNIYHEEKALDILVTFLISDTIFKCTLLSLTKDLKKNKLFVKIDLGLDENLVRHLLIESSIKKINFTMSESDNILLEVDDPYLELVKIKKINERNSYFASIIIVQ